MKTNTQVGTGSHVNVATMAKVGALGAVATVLMMFKIPLWFVPSFLEIDLSEIPVLIGAFALGPVAGIFIELIKILGNLLINSTITFGVGELSNFLIGLSFVLPAAIIYKRKKTRKSVILGMTVGTVSMAVVGSLLNAFLLLPLYAKVMNIPLSGLVAMGTKVQSGITNIQTLVLLGIVPFNIIKGGLVSICTFLLYKHLSPILKGQKRNR